MFDTKLIDVISEEIVSLSNFILQFHSKMKSSELATELESLTLPAIAELRLSIETIAGVLKDFEVNELDVEVEEILSYLDSRKNILEKLDS